jgi:hypothetical protein
VPSERSEEAVALGLAQQGRVDPAPPAATPPRAHDQAQLLEEPRVELREARDPLE